MSTILNINSRLKPSPLWAGLLTRPTASVMGGSPDPSHRVKPSKRRRGVVIQEAMVSLLIVGVVLVAVVQLLAVVARQQRIGQQRLAATHEVGNVMESLMAQPWKQLTTESAKAWKLSDESHEALLPGARLQVSIMPEKDAEDLRRITVQIDWPNRMAPSFAPVRLVAWRFRDVGGGT